MRNVAIVGCGVIGLTSAVRLLEVGFKVTVFGREQPPHTTSDVAAAFWASSSLLGPGRMRGWSLAGLAALTELVKQPESGVTRQTVLELADAPLSVPAAVAELGEAAPATVIAPANFPARVRGGYQILSPAIDTPIYMPYLVTRVQAGGGKLVQTTIDRLESLLADFQLVVNCAGLGAGPLADDGSLVPVRGQVVRIRRPDGFSPDIWHFDAAPESTYIVPRHGDCILGGTYQPGQTNIEPDPATAQAIIERCTALHPQLEQVEVIKHKVGLRPGRPQVRLELVRQADNGAMIHNYGHGALGHTLAWGCAAEVVELARQLI